jgi:hypothetical protein
MNDEARLETLARAFRTSAANAALKEELVHAAAMGQAPGSGMAGMAGAPTTAVTTGHDAAAAANMAATEADAVEVDGDGDEDGHHADRAPLLLGGEGGASGPAKMAAFRPASGPDAAEFASIQTTLARTLPPGYDDPYATSGWTQLLVLAGRSFSDLYRAPMLLRTHMAVAVLAGALIGTIFFNLTLDFAGTQNRFGLLLFVLIVLAFASMSSIGVRPTHPHPRTHTHTHTRAHRHKDAPVRRYTVCHAHSLALFVSLSLSLSSSLSVCDWLCQFMTRELDVFLKERASGYYRPSVFFVVKVRGLHAFSAKRVSLCVCICVLMCACVCVCICVFMCATVSARGYALAL